MFSVGDIVKILAPTTGYKKYHLCIKIADENGAARFLFLNSDPNYADTFSVPCARVPCLPPSDTGWTAFSFSTLPPYNEKQLKIYGAVKLGELSLDVAQDVRAFVDGVEVMTRKEKRMVIEALDAIIAGYAKAAAGTVAGQASDRDEFDEALDSASVQ